MTSQRALGPMSLFRKTLIKDDILLSMFKRYDNHPSIMAIKRFCNQGQSFDFVHVTPIDAKSCIVNLDN